jgi:hypothetical protein
MIVERVRFHSGKTKEERKFRGSLIKYLKIRLKKEDIIMRKSRLIICILGIVLSLMLPMDMAFADKDIFSPDSSPFGTKFKEWSAQWWQFVLSFPFDVNPLFDVTGERCAFGQRGPVWFLMGTFGGEADRTCSIPEGKALFFPILNLVDINATNQTPKELRAEIGPCMDAAFNLSVTVDGEPIKKSSKLEEKFRVRSAVFEVTVPEGGLIPAGIYSPAVDDGFYVMLKPLAVGAHTLHFTGSSPGCDYAPTGFHVDPFSVDVTYHLTITPVSLNRHSYWYDD